jgi:RHS repeat-associated protein
MHKKFYFLFSTIFFLVATSCFSITNKNATYTTVDPPALKVSATMELAADGVEDPLFDNIDETRKNKTADYPYNPDYPVNAKVSKLSTTVGETVGPATILAVKQGDEMSVSTDLLLRFSKYYFTTPLLPQTNQTAEQMLSGIIGSFTTAGLSTLPLDDLGNVINPFIDANSQAASGLNSFIQNSFDSLDTSLPQGYLVTMFFDNDLNLVPEYSGVQRVTEAGSLQKLAVMNQKMPSDGFYYTYVTNQSAQVTQFDNLTYIHIEGVLKEATDYYPYGLLCSSATIASVNTINNYKFQDKEFNRKEFVNTWGLDWYNHGARMYDPELGRWHVQDPALQFGNPYLAMGNNPVSMTDPDGQWAGADDAIVAGAGFVFGYVSAGIKTGNWGASAIGNGLLNAALFEVGYLTAGAGLSATGGASAISCYTMEAAGNYLLSSGISMAAGAVLPSIPIVQSENFNLSVSPTFNMTGLGASINASVSSGDWGFQAGVGVGGGNGFSQSAGLNYFDGTTGFGYNVNSYGGSESQRVAELSIRFGNKGQFDVRMSNDFFPGGDGGDRWRTGAGQFTWRKNSKDTYSAGFMFKTGDKDADGGMASVVPDGRGKGGFYGGENAKDPSKRAGIGFIGYNTFRAGWNSDGIRHAIQNVVFHDNVIKVLSGDYSPWFPRNNDVPSQPYFSNSSQNPYSLW